MLCAKLDYLHSQYRGGQNKQQLKGIVHLVIQEIEDQYHSQVCPLSMEQEPEGWKDWRQGESPKVNSLFNCPALLCNISAGCTVIGLEVILIEC